MKSRRRKGEETEVAKQVKEKEKRKDEEDEDSSIDEDDEKEEEEEEMEKVLPDSPVWPRPPGVRRLQGGANIQAFQSKLTLDETTLEWGNGQFFMPMVLIS